METKRRFNGVGVRQEKQMRVSVDEKRRLNKRVKRAQEIPNYTFIHIYQNEK